MAKFTVDSGLVRKLADLLTETGLSEIELSDGDRTVRVARQLQGTETVKFSGDTSVTVAGPKGEVGTTELESETNHPGTLTSPMVGTVFVAPQPDANPFVQVGDQVTEGQTLLIIEAMKVMNPLSAIKNGVVIKILVKDGQPVEFGESLMVIE